MRKREETVKNKNGGEENAKMQKKKKEIFKKYSTFR